MNRNELILSTILAAALIAGVGYEQWRGGPKSAEVIVTSGNATPFDERDADPDAQSTPIEALDEGRPAPSPTVYSNAPSFALLFLHQATSRQLELLPGVGEVIAQRIIEHRTKQPFQSLDELMAVEGIGEKKFQDILAYLSQLKTAPSPTPIITLPTPPLMRRAPAMRNPTPRLMDLNQINSERLVQIPGIGPALAESILAERARLKGFANWSQVGGIAGIGEERLKLLQKHFTLNTRR